jgi:hypothetical protein
VFNGEPLPMEFSEIFLFDCYKLVDTPVLAGYTLFN